MEAIKESVAGSYLIRMTKNEKGDYEVGASTLKTNESGITEAGFPYAVCVGNKCVGGLVTNEKKRADSRYYYMRRLAKKSL